MNKETKMYIADHYTQKEVLGFVKTWIEAIAEADFVDAGQLLKHQRIAKAVRKYLSKMYKQGKKLQEKRRDEAIAAYEAKRVKPVDTNLQ